MRLIDWPNSNDPDLLDAGARMYATMEELFPIPRSITGDGVRQTLRTLGKCLPMKTTEVPSGTKVFDWTVPPEWKVHNAYFITPHVKGMADFQNCNLSLVGYSRPFAGDLTWEELKQHLHTLPEHPEWIPYLTSYYDEYWGFCLSYDDFQELEKFERRSVLSGEKVWRVYVATELDENGFLTYGEIYKAGETPDEVLLSTYVCHPSLANDNLSGPVMLAELAKYLADFETRYSYRFLFAPETIGAVAWLALNENRVKLIKHGLVATCLGDPGPPTYKMTRSGCADIDRAAMNVLRAQGEFRLEPFFPSGSDERQFCSPGFNLPVGSLMRTMYGRYPEYHTSADNMSFVRPEYLKESLLNYIKVIYVLEHNGRFVNTNPKCEPQLGKRGLYRQLGSQKDGDDMETALLWALNMSDGYHDLLAISDRSGLPFRIIKAAANALLKAKLLEVCEK